MKSWVSRATLDERDRVVRDLERSLAAEQAVNATLLGQVNAAAERYDALLEKYHALRQQGFAQPVPERPMVHREPDAILTAIYRIPASRDPNVRAKMVSQARADEAMGVPADEIIARIQRGTRPAEEMDS